MCDASLVHVFKTREELLSDSLHLHIHMVSA